MKHCLLIGLNKPLYNHFNCSFKYLNFKLLKDHDMFHSGNKTRDLAFQFGEKTDVDAGCAALFKDKMMYFGGRNNKRQVSLLKYVFYSN